jgi:hypothetical protein
MNLTMWVCVWQIGRREYSKGAECVQGIDYDSSWKLNVATGSGEVMVSETCCFKRLATLWMVWGTLRKTVVQLRGEGQSG